MSDDLGRESSVILKTADDRLAQLAVFRDDPAIGADNGPVGRLFAVAKHTDGRLIGVGHNAAKGRAHVGAIARVSCLPAALSEGGRCDKN